MGFYIKIFVAIIMLSFPDYSQAQNIGVYVPEVQSPTLHPDQGLQNSNVMASAVFENCEKYTSQQFNTRENAARRSACINYMFGVSSTLLLLQKYGADIGFCMPENMTTQKVFAQFLGWAKINKDKLDKTIATEAIYLSLKEKYPCMEINSGKY